MKKSCFTLLLLLLSALPAWATTITVSAYTMTSLSPNFTNIGSDRSITVSATNASVTVTSSAAFPSTIVGLGGFRVLIGSDTYTVASVQSTSSLTLTSAYLSSTGSATMTLYKYAIMRVYATVGFQDSSGQNIQPGTPGSGAYYKQFAVSIVNSGSANVAYIPEFTIPSTTDATINNQARYVFGFYRTDGSLISYYLCGSVQQLAVPTTTPTTWTALCSYNGPGAYVPPNTEAYSKPQIDQRFPSCTAGQMIYYLTTGNIQTCLTVGTGLSISGGTITATGGSGSLPTATYTNSNYSVLTTDWLVAVDASSGNRTATLFAASGNTGKIVQVCKNDTSVNTIAITDGSTTLATIYSPTACVQFSSNGSAWKILTY